MKKKTVFRIIIFIIPFVISSGPTVSRIHKWRDNVYNTIYDIFRHQKRIQNWARPTYNFTIQKSEWIRKYLYISISI